MRKLPFSSWIAGLALFITLPSPSVAADREAVVVIANKAAPVMLVSKDQLRLMFQARKSSWPDGIPVRAFNLPEAHHARQSFDLAVLGLEPDRVARYWIDRQVRGGDRPPPIVPSSLLMVKLISKTAGAVGYVEASAVNETVRIVARVVGGELVHP